MKERTGQREAPEGGTQAVNNVGRTQKRKKGI